MMSSSNVDGPYVDVREYSVPEVRIRHSIYCACVNRTIKDFFSPKGAGSVAHSWSVGCCVSHFSRLAVSRSV
jgi:hypothetical protein